MFAAIDDAAGHNSVFNDLRLVVNVSQKQIQRGDSLAQSQFKLFPFSGGDDPGQQVMGKNLFRPLIAAVYRKSDALVEEGLISFVFCPPQLARPQVQKMGVKLAILLSRMLDTAKHLVIAVGQFVLSKSISGTAVRRIRLYDHRERCDRTARE
jgi:hypothetical protein